MLLALAVCLCATPRHVRYLMRRRNRMMPAAYEAAFLKAGGGASLKAGSDRQAAGDILKCRLQILSLLRRHAHLSPYASLILSIIS